MSAHSCIGSNWFNFIFGTEFVFDFFIKYTWWNKNFFDPLCCIILWANYTVILPIHDKIVIHPTITISLKINIKYLFLQLSNKKIVKIITIMYSRDRKWHRGIQINSF